MGEREHLAKKQSCDSGTHPVLNFSLLQQNQPTAHANPQGVFNHSNAIISKEKPSCKCIKPQRQLLVKSCLCQNAQTLTAVPECHLTYLPDSLALSDLRTSYSLLYLLCKQWNTYRDSHHVPHLDKLVSYQHSTTDHRQGHSEAQVTSTLQIPVKTR